MVSRESSSTGVNGRELFATIFLAECMVKEKIIGDIQVCKGRLWLFALPVHTFQILLKLVVRVGRWDFVDAHGGSLPCSCVNSKDALWRSDYAESMASAPEAAVGDAGVLDGLKTPEEDSSGRLEDSNKSRLNETAEPASATTAAEVESDRQDPQAEGGSAGKVLDDVNDNSTKVEDDDDADHPDRQSGRDDAAAEAHDDDKGSITPSAEQKPAAEQQRQQDTAAQEKLVLEKYTLYKTESVSRTLCRQV